MNQKNMQSLIYRYLLARIHYGFYRKGENLPSIYKLSELFGVSTMTVRCAYKMLEESRYILMPKNKQAVIVYDACISKSLPAELLAPQDTLQDLFQSLALILPGTFFCGLILCGKEDHVKLNQILEESNHIWDEPTIRFLSYITRKLDNSLLMDLFYDVILYSYPAFLSRMSQDAEGWKESYRRLYQNLREILRAQKSGDYGEMWKLLLLHYWNSDPFSVAEVSTESGENYQWDHMQIANSIAVDLIQRIFGGIYKEGSFLPSAPALAEEFSASLITMRRAIGLMNDLGVSESINGIGTRVVQLEDRLGRVKWDHPAIQKNILLYLQAMQILCITCRAVAKSTYPKLSRKILSDAKAEISAGLKNGFLYPAIAVGLKLLKQESGLYATGEIYGGLINYLVLGHSLSYIRPTVDINEYASDFTASLESNDADRFALELERMLCAVFRSSQRKAVLAGIKAADRLKLLLLPGDYL